MRLRISKNTGSLLKSRSVEKWGEASILTVSKWNLTEWLVLQEWSEFADLETSALETTSWVL